MKYLFFILICGLLALNASAQKLAQADLVVGGVTSGTTYAETVRKLGKPPRESKVADQIDQCAGGRGKTLFYDGLEIALMGDESGKNQKILDIKVTSPKWTTDKGIKIGATPPQVIARYGKTAYENAYERPTEEKTFTGEKWLVYNMKKNAPGGITFYFKNNRLVRIEMIATTC